MKNRARKKCLTECPGKRGRIKDCNHLSKANSPRAEFDIPNAASKLNFSADLLRRTINMSMKLEAPKDKSRATASINWITRQLKDTDIGNVSIRAYWPKRIPMTIASLKEAIESPSVLLPPGVNELPTSLEVLRVVDLAGRFRGAKTFVEDSSRQFTLFYQDAGQHLSKWVAQPPKVKEPERTESAIPTIFSTSSDVILGDEKMTNGALSTSSESNPGFSDSK